MCVCVGSICFGFALNIVAESLLFETVLASEGFFILKNVFGRNRFFSSLLSLQFLKSPLEKTPALQLMVCDNCACLLKVL